MQILLPAKKDKHRTRLNSLFRYQPLLIIFLMIGYSQFFVSPGTRSSFDLTVYKQSASRQYSTKHNKTSDFDLVYIEEEESKENENRFARKAIELFPSFALPDYIQTAVTSLSTRAPLANTTGNYYSKENTYLLLQVFRL